MLTRRIIACLDVHGGRVVKGTGFVDLRDAGDPVMLAERYERDGADEICMLDISASAEGRATLLDVVRRCAERLFIPLSVGGGIRTVDDVGRALRAGADKVSVNSAAVARPALLAEAAERYGAQCVVASIDAKRIDAKRSDAKRGDATAGEADRGDPRWIVYTHGGRTRTDLDVVEWAVACVDRGAGEILLTSMDRDGARTGYDLELTRAVARAVPVPVIASGGAGDAAHVRDAIVLGEADAALVAGMLHDGSSTVESLKLVVAAAGLPIRLVREVAA